MRRPVPASQPQAAAPPSTVVSRTVAVLEAISNSSGHVGLSELARESGVPKATVHRLCLALLAEGLVDRVADGWTLGPKLFELGQRVPSRRRLRDLTMPFLEDLHLSTRHTVHLAALERENVVYVEKLHGREQVATPSEVAGRMPLHCTATGKCLLAYAPQDLLDRVLGGSLEAFTSRTIVDPARLRGEIAGVRRRGFAAEHDEYALGFSSVAAPVFGMLGTALGAIAVTSGSDLLDERAVTARVKKAAAQATSRFGGRPPQG